MRTLIVAAILIAAIESTIWAVEPSTFVERSALLNANYGEQDPQHRLLLYEKVKTFAHSSPEGVQVGDSSGLHAVDPAFLGLRYVNMSCCANAGYDGYYDLADFMFRRNTSIKHLVLYVSIMGLPSRDRLEKNKYVNTEMVGVALTDGPAYLNVPSMALRRDLLKIVYRRPEVMLHPGYAVLTAHDGWAPAIEPHMEADERPRYCRAFFITDEELYRSHFGPTMARFYNLARRHGARFSLVIDPSACPPDRTWLAARQADVERFLAEHPDAVVYPRQVWEPLPEETYASPIHVLPSYRQILTEGVRRALAKVD